MRSAIKGFIEAGGPVYAECGGFMYLSAALTDHAKRTHPMIGVFPFKIKMLQRLQALGYREVITGRKVFAAPGRKNPRPRVSLFRNPRRSRRYGDRHRLCRRRARQEEIKRGVSVQELPGQLRALALWLEPEVCP